MLLGPFHVDRGGRNREEAFSPLISTTQDKEMFLHPSMDLGSSGSLFSKSICHLSRDQGNIFQALGKDPLGMK